MMRGKIVLLPFPFDDFSATKVRPALCLTDCESWERCRANICVVLKNAFARCFGFDRMCLCLCLNLEP